MKQRTERIRSKSRLTTAGKTRARRPVFETLEPRTLLTALVQCPIISLPVSGDDGIEPAVVQSPSQLVQAYGINNIKIGSLTGTGAGQTIAIIDAYNEPTITSDLAAFDSSYGLAAPPSFQVLNQTGGTSLPANNSSWYVEEALDVEWAHVVAPSANIILYEASGADYNDLLTAVNTARNLTGVCVVSMSWGGSDFNGESYYDSYFSTPSGHTGVTFLAASGDYGSPALYPATSPNVIGVGGTTLTTNGGVYVSETSWSDSGGGPSANETEPSYQQGVQTSGQREAPDVAFDADPNTGVPVYVQGGWTNVGGTSLACPCWAGLIAIADQLRVGLGGTPMDGKTQTLPMLYQLPSSDFHDITSGNNGYAAGPGYDMVTGIGTPVASLLVPALAPYSDMTVAVTDSGNFQQGGTGSFSITASDSGSIATSGQVKLVDTLPSGVSPTAADNGTINGWTVTTSGQTVTATRSDVLAAGTSYPALTVAVNIASNAPASVTDSVVVSGGGELKTSNDTATDVVLVVLIARPTTTVVTAAPGSSVYGQADTFTAAVTSGGSAVTSGTVTFEEGSTILASAVPINGSGQSSFSISTLSAATSQDLITAIYSGTSGYPTSFGSVSQTVTPAPLTVTPTNESKTYGSTFTAFAGTLTGLENGDNITASYASPGAAATAGVAGGPYSITATLNDPNGLLGNYMVTYNSGSLTVTPAPLTVTPANQAKIYGSTFTAFAGTLTGLQNGDNITASYASPGAAATAGVAGGPYLITATLNDPNGLLTNYTVTYNTGNLAVTPAPLTVTVYDQSRTYGTDNPTLTASYSGFVNGQTFAASGITGLPDLSTAATAASPVGTYPITADVSNLSALNYSFNYAVTYNSGNLSVTPAPLTVTPANQAKPYGSAFTAFAGTLAGLQDGDNITASYSSPGAAATAGVAGGPYAITATLNDPNGLLGNYSVTYNTGSLSVTPASIIVTPANETKTYGNAFTAFAGTLTGLENGDAITASYSSPGAAATAGVAGGPYAITATLNDANSLLGNYTVTYNTGSLAVTPAALTVTPTNGTKTYGSTFTTFAGTLAGLQNGDNITASYASPGAEATAGVAGGPYAITATLNDPNSLLGNYTVTYNSGSLAVTPAPLTVTPANETKTYGSTFTAFAGTLAGLQNGDNITASYASSGAAATAGVAGGPYAITATLNDPNSLLGNYTVTYNTGSLAVTPAPLTVTPTNETKTYGSTFTAFAGTLAGLQNGDNITAGYSSPGTAATASVAGGPYAITATLNDPSSLLGNYTVTYNTGSLAVTPAPLTVTPTNETKSYGSTFTAFAGTLTGIENGDAITGSYSSLGAAATAGVAGDPYAITATLNDPNGLLGNYTVTYNSGSLAVTPAPLTVTPANETKTYGSTFTAFAGTLAGLENGDNITASYASPGAAATAGVVGGPYSITATLNDPNGLLGNYTVTYNTGSLAVTPAPLTVTPTNETKTYGSTFTAFAGTLAGLENGDNITASFASPGAATTASVAGGPYAITATLDDPNSLLGNYTVTYNSGSLAVTPAPLTVTPANETNTYGSTFTAFAGTLAGLQNGDNITAGYSSPGTAATASVAGGPYAITATLNDPSSLLGNYTVTYNTGSLAVTPAPLTVTPTNETKSYGSTFTAFAGTLAGLENGDNITASYASPGAAATAGVVGGPYAITATLGDPNSLLGNYTVTYNSGSLAVTPAPLTVTPANETKTYGSTFTAFAGTLAGLENGDNITASYASPGAAATAGVAGGPYAITATLNDPSGLLGNYTVTYNVGSLTVTQEVLTVNSTETTDALELSSNVQAVIGSGGNLTVNNPVELDPGGEVSIVNGGSATLPGVSLQPGAEGVNFDSGTLQAGGGFATSAPISIAAGGATIDSNGFDMSLMGSLTGPGGVTTVGAGSVALLGTNTYAGGTVVSAGTLIAGSRGALPVGSALMVGADASLLFGNQNSVSAGIAVPVAGSAGNVTVATATMTRSAGADTTRTAAFDTATKVTPAKVPMIGSVLLKTANMPAGISASAIHDAAILAAPSKNAARDMIWLDDFYGELSFASAGQNARLSEAALALEAVLAEYARS